MLRNFRFFERNSRSTRQKFKSISKIHMLVLHHKAENIAIFATGPTTVALAARVDVERWFFVVVKRAQTLESGPDGTQRNIAADDIDDVVRFLDLLLQGISVVVHGTLARGRNRITSAGPRHPV